VPIPYTYIQSMLQISIETKCTTVIYLQWHIKTIQMNRYVRESKKYGKEIVPADCRKQVYIEVLISLWLFLFATEPKEIFLDGLTKLEQRSHKCVWSSVGNM
jgi:hypothetical protein